MVAGSGKTYLGRAFSVELCSRVCRPAAVWTLAAVMLAGCSTPIFRAPIENRWLYKNSSAPAQSPAPEGFYRVRRGDTLIGIALDNGVAWRDVMAWNQLENPNVIEVDQLLRVRPPASTRTASAAAKSESAKPENSKAAKSPAARAESKPSAESANPTSVEVRPINGGANSKDASAEPTTMASAPVVEPSSSGGAARSSVDGISLSWPSKGNVVTSFADPGYKGIAIAGSEGDPVLAAGDGRVVYSGNGLRGYGNLVIVKHEGDFLTAYAHNRSILVSEGQAVKRGQKIAEIGKTDSDAPKLHFEVRKSGKPVDPMKYLSQR